MLPPPVLKLRKAAASRYAEEVQRPAEDQAIALHGSTVFSIHGTAFPLDNLMPSSRGVKLCVTCFMLPLSQAPVIATVVSKAHPFW